MKLQVHMIRLNAANIFFNFILPTLYGFEIIAIIVKWSGSDYVGFGVNKCCGIRLVHRHAYLPKHDPAFWAERHFQD